MLRPLVFSSLLCCDLLSYYDKSILSLHIPILQCCYQPLLTYLLSYLFSLNWLVFLFSMSRRRTLSTFYFMTICMYFCVTNFRMRLISRKASETLFVFLLLLENLRLNQETLYLNYGHFCLSNSALLTPKTLQ